MPTQYKSNTSLDTCNVVGVWTKPFQVTLHEKENNYVQCRLMLQDFTQHILDHFYWPIRRKTLTVWMTADTLKIMLKAGKI